MPITVRQAIPGVLGRLAVKAGQARGQQLRMGRDIQLASIAMAAQTRAWDIDAADRAQTFALQRAGAAQIARQRPVAPDIREQQQKLRQFVSKAEKTGIYDPRQIKQARIYADLGDVSAVRSILGKLPEVAKPTSRQRELQRQTTAITKIGENEISKLQEQRDVINKRLGTQFTPGIQQLLRERPEFMATVSPDVQEALAQQQQLEEQISAIKERTAGMKKMLQLGLAVPEQMALEARQEAQLIKQRETKERLEIQRTRGAGGLTEREELAIDVMRDQERDRRTAINREIARLSNDLAPFKDEADDPDKYEKRIGPIKSQITVLELKRTASYGNEKEQIEVFLREGQKKTNVPEFSLSRMVENLNSRENIEMVNPGMSQWSNRCPL